MTLAAIGIAPEEASELLADFRQETGLRGELKGSRIDLDERALLFDMLGKTGFRAAVSIAISAIKPKPGVDRGAQDIEIYAALLEEAISQLLPLTGGCAQILIDDGRYAPATLALVRQEIAALIGPFGTAALEVSHARAGLQLADVISNSFFNRALPTERQGAIASMVEPFLESRQIVMRVLTREAEREDQRHEQG